jgi:hypothetical protein
MTQVENPKQIWSKRKAAAAFFPYAVWRERDGEHGMVDAFLGAARAATPNEYRWNAVVPFFTTLFDGACPNSLNRVITLASPHILPSTLDFNENMVTRWAAAVLAVPYTEEVCQSVVDTLLSIASNDSLQQYIPVETWSWLNKRPDLPPECRRRVQGAREHVVRQVRALGDIEIFKSYLLLVWSEWGCIDSPGGFTQMQISIREDLCRAETACHREDLIKRLDHVLEQLDRGLGYLQQHRPSIDEREVQLAKNQYGELKDVLLEVDREAKRTLTCTPSRLIILFDLLIPADVHRIPLNICLCAPSPCCARMPSSNVGCFAFISSRVATPFRLIPSFPHS